VPGARELSRRDQLSQQRIGGGRPQNPLASLRRTGIATAQIAQQRRRQPLAQRKRRSSGPRLRAVGETSAAVQQQRGIERGTCIGAAGGCCLTPRQVIAKRLHVGPDDPCAPQIFRLAEPRGSYRLTADRCGTMSAWSAS